jgi:hypothetical protein
MIHNGVCGNKRNIEITNPVCANMATTGIQSFLEWAKIFI